MTSERITELKQQYEAELAALVETANRQIAALNGAIAALARLLAEDAPADGAPAEDAQG